MEQSLPLSFPASSRARPEAVWDWIERRQPLPAEPVPVAAALGRVLASPIRASAPIPDRALAGRDGYAVRSDDTVGASAYGPILLRFTAAARLGPGDARAVRSGDPLPEGADAVLGLEDAESAGTWVHACAGAAPGENVVPAGLEADAGDVLAAPGPLRPDHLARLRLAGVGQVSVVRRPAVRLVPAARPLPARDADGLMLEGLLLRDGAEPEEGTPAADPERVLRQPGTDLVLLYGGSGEGDNDHAAAVLAAAGIVLFPGVALHPGETVAIGRVGEVPVVVLPGAPLSCLCAYELIAGPLVRRLGGRPVAWPYGTRRAVLRRKIASGLGRLELCRVRLDGRHAEPLGIAGDRALRSAADADGFVLVPVDSEGYPEDTEVDVHVFP